MGGLELDRAGARCPARHGPRCPTGRALLEMSPRFSTYDVISPSSRVTASTPSPPRATHVDASRDFCEAATRKLDPADDTEFCAGADAEDKHNSKVDPESSSASHARSRYARRIGCGLGAPRGFETTGARRTKSRPSGARLRGNHRGATAKAGFQVRAAQAQTQARHRAEQVQLDAPSLNRGLSRPS